MNGEDFYWELTVWQAPFLVLYVYWLIHSSQRPTKQVFSFIPILSIRKLSYRVEATCPRPCNCNCHSEHLSSGSPALNSVSSLLSSYSTLTVFSLSLLCFGHCVNDPHGFIIYPSLRSSPFSLFQMRKVRHRPLAHNSKPGLAWFPRSHSFLLFFFFAREKRVYMALKGA